MTAFLTAYTFVDRGIVISQSYITHDPSIPESL